MMARLLLAALAAAAFGSATAIETAAPTIGTVVHTSSDEQATNLPFIGRVVHVSADQPQALVGIQQAAPAAPMAAKPAAAAAPPAVPVAAEQPNQLLNFQMLSGQWYEIARSRKAAEKAQRGCACNLAFFEAATTPAAAKAADQSPLPTLKAQFVCRNESLGAAANAEASWVRADVTFTPSRPGLFAAKMTRSPSGKKLLNAKERRVVLLAAGPEFSAWLDTDRGIAHILSRKPKMEADLFGGLTEVLTDAGVAPNDLVAVNHDEALCRDFNKLAATRLSAPAKPLASAEAIDQRPMPPPTLPPGPKAAPGLVAPSAAKAEKPATGEQQQPREGEAPPPLNSHVFAGRWYEIAASQRVYDTFERGCECSQKNFVVVDDNTLDLTVKCHNTTDNQVVTATARSIQPQGAPGVFRVELRDLQPYGLKSVANPVHEKVVIAMGKDSYIVGEPAINSIWIYSRAPTMSDELFARLSQLLQAIGVNTADLHKTKHSLPQCAAINF